MRTVIGLTSLLLLVFWASPAAAQPPGNEGISFGWEQTIVHAADLSPADQAALKADSGLDLAVGFAYYRAYLFSGSFSLWNWHGRYVLFDGDNVFDLQPGELEKLLGPQAASQLRVPLLYRLPVGLATLLVLVIALCIGIYFGSRKTAAVQKLAGDPRYQAALEVYCAALPPAEEQTTLEHRRAALQTAIEYMASEHKVPPEEADTKVRSFVAAFDEARSKDLRYQASLHEQAGEWDAALDLYEEAAELRELWDEKDHAYLLKCIARVEKKQASS